ncbi:hypothetical protein [Roseibium sp. MMSF_3412]|uniref:hypothetical protein n=1 Tax=Roseibium sp. MMSF_3412 TaxID=3046712 RepID=UPI00273ECC10|nr:hypothetical protein [Roseibium sp. MMSF_3412]
MGELLNRDFQRVLLEVLADSYPRFVLQQDLPAGSGNEQLVNMAYLEEHGLVRMKWFEGLIVQNFELATITAKGLDFLQDDGGLGEVLGVVTVRLDDETIKALLIDKVAASDTDAATKSKIIEEIQKMPSSAVRTVGQRLMKEGLDRLPGAVDWIVGIF